MKHKQTHYSGHSDHHSCDKHTHHLPKNEKKIAIAAVLIGGFMWVEVVGGLISGSLALLADAGHMLMDFASLLLAWLALRLAKRPADCLRTYGSDRFSVLAAFVNGLSLFVIAVWISYEAIERILTPQPVLGGMMFWVALFGLWINIVAFIVLMRGDSDNLNIRAAALHVMGDLLGSVAAIVAAVVIIFTGWTLIDPILSVLVTLIILKAAWQVVKESGHILLEATPKGFDRAAAKSAIKALEGVQNVSHFHAWSVTQERPMATLEVTIAATADHETIRTTVKSLLAEQFNIDHSTVEVILSSG